MKTITALAAATLTLVPLTALADGNGNTDWAEEAAKKYEHKAEWAEKEGMPKAAAIYRRMAEIKREAGRASKRGKKHDWSEYHQLEGQLNEIKKDHHKHANKDHKKDHKKDGGDGFLRAANEYRKNAEQARAKGDTQKAEILEKLAAHKVAASKAASDGKGYDWSEYHALQKKLHGDKGECEKPKQEQKKDWANKEHDHKPAGKLNIE